MKKMCVPLLLLALAGCSLSQKNNGEIGFRFSGFGIGFYHNAPHDGSEISANVPLLEKYESAEGGQSIAPEPDAPEVPIAAP